MFRLHLTGHTTKHTLHTLQHTWYTPQHTGHMPQHLWHTTWDTRHRDQGARHSAARSKQHPGRNPNHHTFRTVAVLSGTALGVLAGSDPIPAHQCTELRTQQGGVSGLAHQPPAPVRRGSQLDIGVMMGLGEECGSRSLHHHDQDVAVVLHRTHHYRCSLRMHGQTQSATRSWITGMIMRSYRGLTFGRIGVRIGVRKVCLKVALLEGVRTTRLAYGENLDRVQGSD